jgi:outer membrane protein assembly factor BamA
VNIQIDINEETAAILASLGLPSKAFKQEKADPDKITALIETLLEKLENNGYPFAQVGFEGLSYENNQLKTRLKIIPNFRLKWTSIEVIGNSVKLSPKFIAAYIGVNEGEWFNQRVDDLVALRLKQLTYLKETKAHELLFTPEGVQLFLYLESRPVSSFNGTVGLQQNPVTLSYQLTGDLRLKLQNAFKKGELMELNWKSIAPGSPQLRIQTNVPYFLQTPFGIDGQFQLFKRDSTFLELKTGFGVSYFVSKGNTLK